MGLNKVLIIGRLGKDPEVRSAGQAKVATFSVAVTENWVKDGRKHEKTEWLNVVAWNKLADLCEKYLRKGRQVFLEGKIQTESYEKNGETRFATKIVASSVVFLDQPEADDGEQENDPFGF